MKKETIEKCKEESSKDFSYHVNETGDYRDTWRIFRIMSEFVEGYQFLNQLKKEVTLLGSARLPEDDKYYQVAKDLGGLLAKGGYTTITGGGPGIMEAANTGADLAGGESVGLNIQLPFEQRINPHVKKSMAFYYFFTRKVMLTSPAHAFVYFPGGYGTLDEFFEVVNHMELGMMCHVPIILVGKDFWQPVLNFLDQKVCALSTDHRSEMDKWILVDSAEEAYKAIEENKIADRMCSLSPMNFHSGTKNVDWRIFRIMSELVEGFEFLTGVVEDVTVLGTRSLGPDSTHYEHAQELGQALAEAGFAVVTGGASGIAEGASKGAMEAGGESLGIGMEMNRRVELNPYLSRSISFSFPFTRKLIVTAPSKAFVFFPGGFGTMHHLFEVLTLIQTEKMEKVPIILFGKKYWEPLDAYIKEQLATQFQTISKDDINLYTLVDTTEEALTIINTFRPNGKTA